MDGNAVFTMKEKKVLPNIFWVTGERESSKLSRPQYRGGFVCVCVCVCVCMFVDIHVPHVFMETFSFIDFKPV